MPPTKGPRVNKETMWGTTHDSELTAASEAKASIATPQSVTQQTQNPATPLPWNSQTPSTQNKSYAHNPVTVSASVLPKSTSI